MTEKATDNYTLRPLIKADLTEIVRWFQDVDDLALFDRTTRVPYDLQTCERYWNLSEHTNSTDEKCWFAIASAEHEIVGIVGLESISSVNRDAVIPIYIDKSHRGKGVGIRATALILDFAFMQLGMKRVTSYYRDDNAASRDLTRKLGFQIEGRVRKGWFAGNTFHDVVVIGILADEWMERREVLAHELDTETVTTIQDTAPVGWRWPPQQAVVAE